MWGLSIQKLRKISHFCMLIQFLWELCKGKPNPSTCAFPKTHGIKIKVESSGEKPKKKIFYKTNWEDVFFMNKL